MLSLCGDMLRIAAAASCCSFLLMLAVAACVCWLLPGAYQRCVACVLPVGCCMLASCLQVDRILLDSNMLRTAIPSMQIDVSVHANT